MPPSLVAIALNNLTFGTILPGIPSTINAHDPHRAALFRIEGMPGASIRVECLLPAALSGPAGAQLPVAFGPADGYYDYSLSGPATGASFDPRLPLITILGASGQLYVRLGGSALPERVQPRGGYEATIRITVYDLGT